MRLPSYLQKSKFGIYYFRICFAQRVRDHLDKWEFKRSLGTRDKSKAIFYSKAISIRVNLFLHQQVVLKMDWLATKNKLNELVDEIVDKFEENIMEHGTYGNHITNYPELPVEKEAIRFINLKSKKVAVDICSFDILKKYTNEIVENYKLNSEPDKLERNMVQVAEMLIKLRNKRLSLVESLYLSSPFLFEEYKKQIQDEINKEDVIAQSDDKQPINSLKTISDNDLNKGITLRMLIDKFIEYKKLKGLWGSPKTIDLNVQKLNYIYEFFVYIKGTDLIYLNDLNASDAINFEKYFSILPKNRTKKYPDATIKELIEISNSKDFQIGQRISSVTYNSYVDLLSGMFNYAAQPKQNYIKNNCFIDLKVKAQVVIKRTPFNDSDIKMFFSDELFQKKKFDTKYAWRYWIPIILLYHGLRLEECAQLLLCNITIIDGIYCFNIKEQIDKNTGIIITKLKNTSSERIVPIHKQLINIGFINYVSYLKELNQSKLFPDLSNYTASIEYKKCGAKVSRWFNEDDDTHYKKSYLTRCGINGDGKPRKVLYAFRHTVQSQLNNHPSNIENDKIDMLFGHSTKSIGRKFYGGYNPETLLKVIQLIEYPKSDLPWMSDKHYNKIKFPWET